MDFFATEPHFVDHLAPIWKAMPAERAGHFFVSDRCLPYARGSGLDAKVLGTKPRQRHVVVASYGDLKKTRYPMARERTVAFLEHGVGFRFGDHPSYSGGKDRADIDLYLATNDIVRRQQLASYPSQRVEVVGCPKLDEWYLTGIHPSYVADPVVAVSFHWEGVPSIPETRSALGHYQNVLPKLAKDEEFELLGHGHPRAWPTLSRLWRWNGTRATPKFDDVLREANVYVADATSTLYEFAATGKPVVVLNAPWYRRHIRHGLRFWDLMPGEQVDHAHDLRPAILRALNEDLTSIERRAHVVEQAYPHIGRATERAVAILEEWEDGK